MALPMAGRIADLAAVNAARHRHAALRAGWPNPVIESGAEKNSEQRRETSLGIVFGEILARGLGLGTEITVLATGDARANGRRWPNHAQAAALQGPARPLAAPEAPGI